MLYRDISDMTYDVFMLYSSIPAHEPTEPSIVGALASSTQYGRKSDQYSVKQFSFSQRFLGKKIALLFFFRLSFRLNCHCCHLVALDSHKQVTWGASRKRRMENAFHFVCTNKCCRNDLFFFFYIVQNMSSRISIVHCDVILRFYRPHLIAR